MWKHGFSPRLHIQWATPCHFFHFFLIGCVGWNINLLISSKKLGTFSFLILFIFVSLFLPIFQKKYFLAHLPPFNAPPWTTPHQLWPSFVPPHLLSPTNLSMTLWIRNFFEFLKFFEKLSFGNFWPFNPLETPSKVPD